MSFNIFKDTNIWLTSLLENMVEAVIATDAANCIIAMNPVAETLTGWSQAEVEGQDIGSAFQHISDNDTPPIGNPIILNLNKQTTRVLLVAKHGSATPVEVRAAFVRNGAEQICGKLVIFRDVSETVQANNTLWNTVQRFRILTENSTDIVLTLDAQAICRYASPSTGVKLGYNLADVVGKSIFELVHSDEVTRVKDLLATLCQDQARTSLKAEWRWQHQNGSWRTLAVSITNFLDTSPINGLVLNCFDVTSYKETKEALHQSEQFLQATLDSLSAQIAVLDKTGQIIAVNGAWRNFANENDFGQSDYGMGQNYLMICDSAIGEGAAEAKATAAGIRTVMQRTQQEFYLEYPCHSPTQQRWYSVRITPFKDEEPIRVVVAHEDITDRARLEVRLTAIHQLGQELTLLHDEAAIIRRVLDTATWILKFKSIGYAWVSVNTQELIYRYQLLDGRLGIPNIHLPLTIDEPNLGVQVVLSGRPQHIADVTSSYPQQDLLEGELIRSELCVPLKIRERVTGVLYVKHTRPHSFTLDDQRVLQTLAMQAAVALENARLYIETQRRAKQMAVLNRATRMVASTLEFTTVLEKTIAEVRTMLNVEGSAILLYDPKHEELAFAITDGPYPDTLANLRLPLSKGVAGWVARSRRPAIVNDVKRDPRFYKGIDEVTNLSTQSILATPILFQDKLVGIFEVINKFEEDFTQQDLELLDSLSRSVAIAIENARLYQAEREQYHRLQQSQAQLIQIEKMAALGRLVGSIAHEINNPIQAIQNCMILLQEEAKQRQRPDKITTFTNIAADELKRIAAIVRRMLEYYDYHESQNDAVNLDSIDDFFHIIPSEMQHIDLHVVIDSVLQLTQKQLQKKCITVERNWVDKSLTYRGSPDRLKQVFLNLILNTADAMSQQKGRLTITTAIKSITEKNQTQSAISITFSDTGAGIAEEVLPHIFEPMFTTKQHGSGFGLFICYKIIEAHGGQITVKSQIDSGTTFTILLPLETD